MKMAFIQPFGLQSPGGGSRILRSLLQEAPNPWISICTSPVPPPPTTLGKELHIPVRPFWGRIETTRYASLPMRLERAFAQRFRNRLEAACQQQNIDVIHAIPHGLDFWYAFQVAKKMNKPYYLNVHDELAYQMKGKPHLRRAALHLEQAWKQANGRIVISENMGREYCSRYGALPYEIITDGLASIASEPAKRPSKSLRVYFMGLMHHSYIDNFRLLFNALDAIQQENPSIQVKATLRCGQIWKDLHQPVCQLNVLPLGTEQDVEADMQEADMLYLPLPFGREVECFSRFSLSTKMVTYLGTGVPILYHGPANAAAGQLLQKQDAAICVSGEDVNALRCGLKTPEAQRQEYARNALKLASKQFQMAELKSRFWNSLTA